MEKYILYCDGASRGNPGPAAYGFAIIEGKDIVAKGGECIGMTTNNVAEYQALIKGLEKCRDLGVRKLLVRMDSQLVVRQIEGIYKVKNPHLRTLFEEAKIHIAKFQSFSIEHIRREENDLADSLANLALDKRENF